MNTRARPGIRREAEGTPWDGDWLGGTGGQTVLPTITRSRFLFLIDTSETPKLQDQPASSGQKMNPLATWAENRSVSSSVELDSTRVPLSASEVYFFSVLTAASARAGSLGDGSLHMTCHFRSVLCLFLTNFNDVVCFTRLASVSTN